MNGLGLAATEPNTMRSAPVLLVPGRVRSRPRGLDVEIKTCVRCGASFTRPLGEGYAQWNTRRYCSQSCYRLREPAPLADRFWRYVHQGPGCWEWQAARQPNGYGSFGLTRDTQTPAHRFSWELHFGPIPDGMFVCHHCDNPPCVRPDHLFLGTPLANVRDMDRKGRRRQGKPAGERHGNAKLTDATIREIAQRVRGGESYSAIGADYGVTGVLIGRVARGEGWKHIERETPVHRGHVQGERNPSAKLTAEAVRSIRAASAAGEYQRVIAERFGVSSSLVGQVLRGQIWKHVR